MSDKSRKKKRTKKELRVSAAERKRKQRERDKSLGYVQLNLRVPAERADEVRDLVASFPDPVAPVDPAQMNLLDESD